MLKLSSMSQLTPSTASSLEAPVRCVDGTFVELIRPGQMPAGGRSHRHQAREQSKDSNQFHLWSATIKSASNTIDPRPGCCPFMWLHLDRQSHCRSILLIPLISSIIDCRHLRPKVNKAPGTLALVDILLRLEIPLHGRLSGR